MKNSRAFKLKIFCNQITLMKRKAETKAECQLLFFKDTFYIFLGLTVGKSFKP